MDYVLFGMGYGATLMLLGWALRTFGPERKYKDIDPEDIDRTILQRRWIRFIQGLGGVISIAGTAMVAFTFITMLVNPDDETGGLIALAVWAFLAIAVLVWCWFYISNFGATGIWSPEEGYGIRGTATTSLSRSNNAGLSTTRVVPKPRIADRDIAPGIGPSVDEATNEGSAPSVETAAGIEDESLTATGQAPHEDVEPVTSETEAASDDESDPEYDFGDSTDTTVPSEIGGRAEAVRRLRERQSRSGDSSN